MKVVPIFLTFTDDLSPNVLNSSLRFAISSEHQRRVAAERRGHLPPRRARLGRVPRRQDPDLRLLQAREGRAPAVRVRRRGRNNGICAHHQLEYSSILYTHFIL